MKKKDVGTMRGAILGCLAGWLLSLAHPAEASMAFRLSFDQLSRRADRVVVSRVISAHSDWDASHRRIFTTYEIEVEEDIAGQGPRRFSLVQPGGTVGHLTQRTFGLSAFQPGQRVLLFLGGQARGPYVVGLSQGVFDVVGAGQRERLVQRLDLLGFPDGKRPPLTLSRREATAEVRSIFRQKRSPR